MMESQAGSRMRTGVSGDDTRDTLGQLENIKDGIREVTHEINNPLGIIRMATYFLQTTNPMDEKRDQYFAAIDESLDRIEQGLQQLKVLRENPSAAIKHSSK